MPTQQQERTAAEAFRQAINPYTYRVKYWLCRKLLADQFFNRDASIEIDRLILENERLRAEAKV